MDLASADLVIRLDVVEDAVQYLEVSIARIATRGKERRKAQRETCRWTISETMLLGQVPDRHQADLARGL